MSAREREDKTTLARKSSSEIEIILSNAERLNQLLVKELDIILKVISHTKSKRKSATKTEKVNFLSSHVGDGSTIQRFTRVYQSLQKQACKILLSKSCYTKDVLNAVYSTIQYKKREMEWESQSPFAKGQVLEDRRESIQWFSYQSYSHQNNQ